MSAEGGDRPEPAPPTAPPTRRAILRSRLPAVAVPPPGPEPERAQKVMAAPARGSMTSALTWLIGKVRGMVGFPETPRVVAVMPPATGEDESSVQPRATVPVDVDVPAMAPEPSNLPAVSPDLQPGLLVSSQASMSPRTSPHGGSAGGNRRRRSGGAQESPEDSARLDAEFVAQLTAMNGTRPVYTPAMRAPVSFTFSPSMAPRLRMALTPDLYVRLKLPGRALLRPVSAEQLQGTRELVIGFDFGTSAVKVVIADRSTGQAYAVPFALASGLARYLLPSRVYQSAAGFQLDPSSDCKVHRDLKLGLLGQPDALHLARSAAFLALVVRHARDWFLSEHGAAYRRSTLVWSMRLGQPAATNLAAAHAQVFRQIGLAAWAASFETGDGLPVESVERALGLAAALEAGVAVDAPAQDIELKVVPEIAAQIYGFVQSRSFDPHARNLYLMVDVGAGTVDAAIFHVMNATGAKWDFEFYTCTVRPYGSMNLHRSRLDWWSRQLADIGQGHALADDIAAARFPTDRAAVLPDSVCDYVEGVQVSFSHVDHDPDATFFSKCVAQVRGEACWQAWKQNFLSQADLSGLPAFLCGGGSRMGFYQRLKRELQHMPGFTWLRVNFEPLMAPDRLEAPGLSAPDYDRLSVAYGLSFLDVGDVGQGLPLPKLPQRDSPSWRHGYPDHGIR